MRKSDAEWEKLGKSEPYYGVLTEDRFRTEELGEEDRRKFFETGEEYIESILTTARSQLDPAFHPVRALDFGCGVGRCTIPLSRACEFVQGLDVSPSMLEEARKNCAEREASNVKLTKCDDSLSQAEGSFDLVHCSLVFQHIEPARGEKIFARLIELLEEGGIGIVQFLIGRDASLGKVLIGSLRNKIPIVHGLANLAYGKPFDEPLMEKNIYSFNRLLTIIHESGCGNVNVKTVRHHEQLSAVLWFQKKPDHVPLLP